MPEKQVKSKQRVADHGEVFTNEREVKAMCDLVKQETERIAVLFSFVSLAFSLNRGEQGKYLIPPKPLYPAVVRKNALPPL